MNNKNNLKILVAFDTIDAAYDLLSENFSIIRPPKGRDFTRDEILKHIVDCDALCSVFDIPIDCEILEKGGRLKMVANYAVGYNNIDLEAAKRCKIVVTNTPRSVVLPTAELVLGLLLSVSRRIAELDRMLRREKEKLNIGRIGYLSVDIYEKKIGIIGFGNIGKAVAERCRAFGMSVLYNKRHRLSEEEEKERGIRYASIDEIFETSDVVSLHTPLTEETYHLANKDRLNKMKKGAILLNTARGAVVDEKALIEVLKKGEIFAGLDVFENKDRPSEFLYQADNVVMTPHVGTQTYDGRLKMAKEMCDNLTGFFFNDGKEVSFVVSPGDFEK